MYTSKNRFHQSQPIAAATTFAGSLNTLFADKKAYFEGTEASSYFLKLASLREALLSTTGKSSVVSTLDAADRSRDGSLRNFFTGLDAYRVFPNEETLAAAKELSELLSEFTRNIANEKYATQSADAARFFAKLHEEKAQALLKTLPYMSELAEKAEADEEEFKRVNKEYTQALAAASEAKSATVVKKELVAFINEELLPYLNAINVLHKGKYDSFLKEIDVELSRAATSKKASKTK